MPEITNLERRFLSSSSSVLRTLTNSTADTFSLAIVSSHRSILLSAPNNTATLCPESAARRIARNRRDGTGTILVGYCEYDVSLACERAADV